MMKVKKLDMMKVNVKRLEIKYEVLKFSKPSQ